MEETHEIVIDYTDSDKFKEGMREIRRQMWHIESQTRTFEEHRDRLIRMRSDAINSYCDPDNEIRLSKIEIPKHIAKVD